jgi:hypothetical protein
MWPTTNAEQMTASVVIGVLGTVSSKPGLSIESLDGINECIALESIARL